MKNSRTVVRHILCLFACLAAFARPVSAQEEIAMDIPNLKKIEAAIRDFDSDMYYPALMKRYAENDTTLTLDEFRHLYLGYSFQESYNPYRISPHIEKLMPLYTLHEHTEKECNDIIKYATRAIEDFPFDLRQINMLIYAYRQKGMNNTAAIWEYKLRSIVNAILSTGDGKSPQTAWYVIYPTHEYDVVNRQGFTGAKYNFVEPSFDYLEVEKNPLNVKGYYFNVSRILQEYDRKYKE
ncbi:MAG: DUF4919 domain-containing protein [Coprobacter sp.]|nr:DUF4919 domain-containing protein [Coprobacter sp.]